jgi:hypothetical protein
MGFDLHIRPRQADEKGGILCLPCARNLPPVEELAQTHPDWKLITCPSCGEGCYVMPTARAAMDGDPTLVGLCTNSALRIAAGQSKRAGGAEK